MYKLYAGDILCQFAVKFENLTLLHDVNIRLNSPYIIWKVHCPGDIIIDVSNYVDNIKLVEKEYPFFDGKCINVFKTKNGFGHIKFQLIEVPDSLETPMKYREYIENLIPNMRKNIYEFNSDIKSDQTDIDIMNYIYNDNNIGLIYNIARYCPSDFIEKWLSFLELKGYLIKQEINDKGRYIAIEHDHLNIEYTLKTDN